MRLTSMTVKNFKSIDENGLTINFAPITLLFGPNNAGKSTIIKAIHLAREFFCVANPDFDHISTVDLGTFHNYVHKHDLSRIISLKLTFRKLRLSEFLPSILGPVEDINDVYCADDRLYLDLQKTKEDKFLDKFITNAYGDTNIENISISFELGWNSGKCQAEAKNIKIYINQEEFLAINVISKKTEHNSWCEGELIPSCSLAEDFVQHYLNIQKEFASSTAEWEYVLEYPSIIPLGKTGVPYWSYDYAIKAKVIEKMRNVDTGQIISINNSQNSIVNTILAPCLGAREFLATFISLEPLRTMPTEDDLKPQEVTMKRWRNGLAAWSELFICTQTELASINKALDGEASLNTGYKIVIKDYLSLDKSSELSEVLNRISKGELPSESETAKVLIRKFLEEIPNRKIWLQNTRSGTLVQPQDMGAGISQILPVVIAAFTSSPNTLIAIEQPELHIHPAWQVELGDLFIEANKSRPPKMFILETHSEHLLLRLLRRIRESEGYPKIVEESDINGIPTVREEKPKHFLKPEDLSVYWIGMENDCTQITHLEINESGEFNTIWPQGFFEERGEELFG